MLRRSIQVEAILPMLGAGIFITGGCSQLRGIRDLAEEVFGGSLRVDAAHAQSTSGLTAASGNPQFATSIGLLRYAQATYANRPPDDGLFGKFRKFFGRR